MRTLLATTVALIVLAPATATAAAADPAVVTGSAQAGSTTATLNGTVDPNLEATSYHFEYGTTADYGLETPTLQAGSGDEPVPVQATVSGLTPSTTYHYRLVADGVLGLDATFQTTASTNPAPPTISRLAAADKTPTSARLTARIDPNRAATTWHAEWGTTTRLGNRTPEQTIPTGDGGVPVSVALANLPTHTRIYWRVVALNAAGLRRSGTTSFTTLRAPTGITLSAFPETVRWGEDVSVSGRVQGSGVNGLTVALQQSAFPFAAGFQEVATARTSSTGTFRFPSRPLTIATRFRAVTRTAVSVMSSAIRADVRARVGIRRTARTRRALTLSGRVRPGLPEGRATLQRRTRNGGWAFVRRKALVTADTSASRYRFRVRRLRRAAVYRVKVSANDGGAHRGAKSRSLLVGKKRRG
jgi:hypothetical protein